jgi:hypothetical protein
MLNPEDFSYENYIKKEHGKLMNDKELSKDIANLDKIVKEINKSRTPIDGEYDVSGIKGVVKDYIL